jgi:hypothetical protein
MGELDRGCAPGAEAVVSDDAFVVVRLLTVTPSIGAETDDGSATSGGVVAARVIDHITNHWLVHAGR